MKEEKQGIILEVNGQRAKVKVQRHGDCENCGLCGGDSALFMEVNNAIDAKKGEKVAFEAKEQGMLRAAFIVYVLPMIAAFIGAWLGNVISEQISMSSNTLEIIGGILFFVLSILFIYYYEKSTKNNIKKLPKVLKKL